MTVTTEHFYSGNNSTTSFAYTFPYYKTSDIKVKVGGTLKTEATHYNVTGTNVVFTSGNVPGNGTNNIHIYRETDVDTSKATFAAGSSIRATDLNNNELQLLYAAQEVQGQQTAGSTDAEIRAQVEAASDSNVFTDADHTKLNAIEASATADQTDAEIRAAVEAAGDSNVFTDADHTKLNGIESGATGDQTNAEIKTAYEANSNTNAYTDAEKTKLAGIAASAEVNVQADWNASSGDAQILNKPSIPTVDASSVNAAGAVMNTDLGTKGGILVGDGSGDPSVLSVGTNTHVLTADSSTSSGVKWAAASGGGAAITIQEEGSSLSTAAETINFVGANVTASGTGTTKTITVSGGGEVTVQDEGSALSTAATTLNFVGSGVVASGTGATKTITISGGGGAVTTDFQYLELKAHNNTSGAFSAGSADYELVTKGTATAVDPGQAAALMISIGGVLQEPNTGTSIGSNDGFCVDGSSIHFGANLTAHPEYILWLKAAGSHTIDDEQITLAKLEHGTSGNNGKFLRANNGADPTWETVDTTIADDSIVEAKLDIHADPAGTNKFLGYTSNGMEWAVPPDTNTTYSVQDGQLSQNNFTDADHTKLDGIATGATATPTTTRGDIIYRAASADARLAKGTEGHYLKMGANDPEWAAVVGAVADGCIFENDQTISNNYTIASGKGAHSVGPITVNATVTVNGNWVVS